MIFLENIIRFTFFFCFQTANFVQNFEIFRKFPEIADDHNSGTKYARDMKIVSKCVVLDTLLC